MPAIGQLWPSDYDVVDVMMIVMLMMMMTGVNRYSDCSATKEAEDGGIHQVDLRIMIMMKIMMSLMVMMIA